MVESARSAHTLIHPQLMALVYSNGWPDLSPVQKKAIPLVLGGRDCVIEAPTAGGKTEAVLFPTLTRASATRRSSVQVLYLAPLRALLNNLELRAIKYAEACGLRAFKWHGDVDQKEKIDSLRHPPQLLLTTPESLEAILLRKAEWRTFFGGLECIIIDEAHNFAAGDRGGHLLSVIQRVSRATPHRPQRIALTATIGNPDDLLEWIQGTSEHSGLRLQVGGTRRERDFLVQFFEDEVVDGETSPEKPASWRQFLALHRTLAGHRSIVFAGSRLRTEALAKALTEYGRRDPQKAIRVATHHASVSRYFREEAEQLIQRSGEVGLNAILSTSTLELGIDIGELDRVVQVGSLSSPSAFLQRVGRTGRREGRSQYFRGLVTAADDLVLLTATIQLGLEQRPEALPLPRRAFHLLAHQTLCLVLQHHGLSRASLWDEIRGVSCFSEVERHEFHEVLDHMVATDYLTELDGLLGTGMEAEKAFLGSNWRRMFAVFEAGALYEVLDGQKEVGTLDSRFVESLEVPFHFVLAGRLWLAQSIEPHRRRVKAQRAQGGEPPFWSNFGGPDVPFETARQVGDLLRGRDAPTFLDAAAVGALTSERMRVAEEGWREGRICFLLSAGGQASLITYAGDRINRTLARVLQLDGLGKVTARYDRVRIWARNELRDREALRARVIGSLDRLRLAGHADLQRLKEDLTNAQATWPFSPFAQCLPPRLWASTLVERSLDVDGLTRLISSCELWEP